MKFCLHKFGRWSEPYVDAFAGEGKLLQATRCEKCLKVQIARVRQPLFSRSVLSDVLRVLCPAMSTTDKEKQG